MKTRSRKNTMNVALKVAIVRSRRTQRALSKVTRIPEVRVSDIVRGKPPVATPIEREALAKALRCSVAELFPEPEAAIAV